jgi:hypothetical protein
MQTVHIPGFDRQRIEVELPGTFSAAKLYVNGQVLDRDKKGQYLLRADDGREMAASFKGGFPDPVPVLVVNGQTIRLAEPMPWYQLVWAFFPFVLVLVGGLVGGLIGGVTAAMNAQIMRSQQPAPVRYLLTGLLSVVAIGLWLGVVAMIRR